MQTFLIALAMEILKYYGPKLGEAAMKVVELEKALRDNKRKAGDYSEVVNSPADRDKRRDAENEALE